jgi:DNA-binding NarL/FixJ family response regulator
MSEKIPDIQEAIVRAIQAVHDGEKTPEEAALSVMREFQRESVDFPAIDREREPITTRAVRIMKLRAEGVPVAMIAQREGISPRRVWAIIASMTN